MEWGFLWIMFALKIPLAMLLWLVWWAIKQTPEEADPPQDGGGGAPIDHPHGPVPSRPRRGPHGDPAPSSPPRVRTAAARTRAPER